MIGQNKMGFRIPFARWMREEYDHLIQWYFSEEFLRKQGLFDDTGQKKMLQSYRKTNTTDYARRSGPFCSFQLWYEHYFPDISK